MSIKITTNRHWRPFLYSNELPTSARSDFDYLNDEEFDCATFFAYKGAYYDLGEILRPPNLSDENDPFRGWDGYRPDSYFSGILIKLSRDGDAYQIATYIS